MRRLLPVVALFAAACSMGGSGTLEPVFGNGVERAEESDTALVRADGVSATVSAEWAAEASQSAGITYVNAGRKPVSITLSRLVMRHRLGDALLWSASDMIEVNYDDGRTDNDRPRPIDEMDDDGRGVGAPLVLKPRERRTLLLGFTNYPGEERIKAGDRVPLGSRDAVVTFEAG